MREYVLSILSLAYAWQQLNINYKKIQGEIEEVGYFSILRNFQLSGSKSKIHLFVISDLEFTMINGYLTKQALKRKNIGNLFLKAQYVQR